MAEWIIKLNETVIKTFAVADGQTVTIGRGKECDVCIDNTAISRQHLSLRRSGGIYFLSDMGSTNGSFVNGKKIDADEPVTGDDLITFGKFTLAPTRGGEGGRQAASVAVDAMPMDEATVFVKAKQPGTGAAGHTFRPKAVGPRLVVVQGEATPKEISLAGVNSLKLGKDASCDLVIPGWLVARTQAYIVKRDSNYLLVPQSSWAGTYVNGVKVSEEHTLRSGDTIAIRSTLLRFD